MKFQQAVGFAQAKVVAGEVFAAFEKEFGRHKEVVEGYRAEDADAIIITQGSMSGTAKYVVDKLREEGQKVGAVKIVMFRPFPYEALRQTCGSVKKVAVLDRSAGLGAQGTPLWLETKAALDGDVDVRSYVGGLAGRDISPMTIQKVFEDLRQEAPCDGVNWIDCKDDPMHLREVPLHV